MMKTSYFALHAKETRLTDPNNLLYQGLWLPKRGLVNAIEGPELPPAELIAAAWWTARVALGRMTETVADDAPEVRLSAAATKLLSPLFRKLAATEARRPDSLSSPQEQAIAAALGIADAHAIYAPEGEVFGPAIVRVSEEEITVNPQSPLGYPVILGEPL